MEDHRQQLILATSFVPANPSFPRKRESIRLFANPSFPRKRESIRPAVNASLPDGFLLSQE
jgi:hypothetical protein